MRSRAAPRIIMPAVANSTSTCDSAGRMRSRTLYSMPSATAPKAPSRQMRSVAQRKLSTAMTPTVDDMPRVEYQSVRPMVAAIRASDALPTARWCSSESGRQAAQSISTMAPTISSRSGPRACMSCDGFARSKIIYRAVLEAETGAMFALASTYVTRRRAAASVFSSTGLG